MSIVPAAVGRRAILLDIEGTTTPIRFVYDVLFPYARRHLRRYLEQQAQAPEHQPLIDRLRKEQATHRQTGGVADFVEWLMDRDSKSAALKELQGRIWEEGYRNGELVGEVFDDVRPAFERWRAQHVELGIYSSGSVRAQQLLFRHSSAADLTPFLQWFFDTAIGSKTDPASYQRIAASMSLPPESIVFVSDATRELDAARAAGIQTRLAVRPGNTPAPEHGFDVICSFDEIEIPSERIV